MKSNISLMRRIMVILYDLLLLFSLLFSVGMIAVIITSSLNLLNNQPNSIFFFIITVPVSFFYFYISWKKSGQTLAMRVWKIKLVSFNNKAITTKQIVIRFITAIIGFLVFGLGFLYQLIDKNNHSLHDKLSKTYLIRLIH